MSDNDITHHIDRLKESFLCAAAGGGRLEECSSLLDLGAETEWPPKNDNPTNLHDHDGNDTPVLAAVRNGHKDVAALLLAHGADPMRCSREGDTVLHLAAYSGDERMASLFAPNAAILVTLTNGEGMTAVDVAVARGYTSFAEFLSELCEDRMESDGHSVEVIPEYEECDNDDSSDDSSLLVSSDNNNSGTRNAESFHDAESGSTEGIDSTTSDADSSSSSESSGDFDIDETLHYRELGDGDETSEVDGNDYDDEAEHDVDDIAEQLQHMTELAHSQSIELYQAKYALNNAVEERDKLKKELDDIKAMYCHDGSNLGSKSLVELTSLEEQLKKNLDRIRQTKEELSQSLEEERTCVICRENPKTVLLMACRHLCVCSECGQREELVRCPLCREIILERINVFQ